MNKEDYNKFYIQGSEHYLIPKDVFDELFDEMENWKEENQKLKAELYLYKGVLKKEHEAIYRVNELEEVIDKATNELFILKDMIYKPETREENFEIQRKISSIIKRLNGKEVSE